MTWISFIWETFPEMQLLFPDESPSEDETNPRLDFALNIDDFVGFKWLWWDFLEAAEKPLKMFSGAALSLLT